MLTRGRTRGVTVSWRSRTGSILVLAAVFLVVVFAMVALSVDVGYVALSKNQLQNAADAAALAAALELNPVDENQDQVADQAIAAAIDTAAANRSGNLSSVDLNDGDIELGKRTWNEATNQFIYEFGPAAKPYNIVRVMARRVGNESVPLFFAPLLGRDDTQLTVSALATYQPRDVMFVLDFSSSMNDDSEFTAIPRLGRQAVEANIRQIWQDLGSPTYGKLEFDPHPLSWFGSTNGKTTKQVLGLDTVAYPYPEGSWDEYILYTNYSSSVTGQGYGAKYGMLTLINYWNELRPQFHETPGLWQARQQPVAALKDAVDLFIDYLDDVGAPDQVGLSIYSHTSGGAILESGLTYDRDNIKAICRQRQAGHYMHYTNIGAGMRTARIELQTNSRPQILRMMVLMTDGVANQSSTQASPRQFALDEANLAAAAGIKIHTVGLGTEADTELLQQIADRTGGRFFNVPGGSSIAEVEAQLKSAFAEIAADRPLKLISQE